MVLKVDVTGIQTEFLKHCFLCTGIPSCNESDLKFVQLHKLDFVDVLDAEQGVIINSDKVNC